MKKWIFFVFACIFLLPPSSIAEEQIYAGKDFYLQQVIDIAISNNPELAAFKLEADAAQAHLKQQGLWDNPTFTAESENFSGDNPGFSRSENTFSFSQPFLLGGKRDYRKKIALQEREIARLSYEEKKWDIILAVEVAVYDILLARQKMEFAHQAEEIASDVFTVKQSETDKTTDISLDVFLSVDIEFSEAKMDLLNTKKDLKIAKKHLALLLGDSDFSLGECRETLERKYKIPGYDELKNCLLKNHPALVVHNIREEQGDYLLQYAKAERVPDLELSFGVRQFNEDDTYSFVGGLSVPLPFFNRNQGGIQEALVNQKRIEVDYTAAKNSLILQLDEHYGIFKILEEELSVFRESILPKAEQLQKDILEKYEKQEVPYLAVLEVRRKLFEVRKKYIEKLKNFNVSIAHLERLCTTHFHGAEGEVF